jgi:hypothetical protein
VCVPAKAAAALGGFGPLALCTRVSNTLTLTDPATLRAIQLDVRGPCSCLYLRVRRSSWPERRHTNAPTPILARLGVWEGRQLQGSLVTLLHRLIFTCRCCLHIDRTFWCMCGLYLRWGSTS